MTESAQASCDSLPERVAATGLLASGGAVVVLLSGGRDSTCLLDLAVMLGADACALHVNHGLRGAESEADEAHCAAFCERLGVRLEVERAAAPEGNVQAWARDVRYAAGARLALEQSARLAAAHTTTDQVETILYRLASSPGRRALLGMEAARGLLVRPLLAAGASREETGAWCEQRGLEYRDDSANANPAYARARIRAGLLTAMREADPRAEGNVLRTAELLRDEAAVLDEVVATALAGRDRIALAKLAGLPHALGRLVMRRLAEDATAAPGARAAARLPAVLALDPAGAALDVGDGARVVVERGVVRVERTPPLRARDDRDG